MASIRFHGNRWQARVRRKGHPTVTRGFLTRRDAERWAREIELSIDRGLFADTSVAENQTLAQLIERYLIEVLPQMKGIREDGFRLRALLRRPIAKISMSRLTPAHLAEHRDLRLHEVSPGTVIRELACLSTIINTARREWGLTTENPLRLVRRPAVPRGRDRLFTKAELARLFDALEPVCGRSIWMKPLVQLALETGMRRGELLSLRWGDVDLAGRTATLWQTKNGDKRVVPLSSRAVALLSEMPRALCGRVFPMTPFAVSKAWDTATRRAAIPDAHFHDLRHLALTQIATKVANLVELASISGHRSLAMLKRYLHPDPQALAKKLG
jgi:integrase